VSLCFRAQLHGPELPDEKMSPTKANACLPVEDWTRRGNSRYQHEQQHQRQPERQQKQNAGNIESGFPARLQNACVWMWTGGGHFDLGVVPLGIKPQLKRSGS
jgi:hypothetical protein